MKFLSVLFVSALLVLQTVVFFEQPQTAYAAECNLSSNGSFEAPNIQTEPDGPGDNTVFTNGWAVYRTTTNPISGWEVVSGTVDLLRYYFNASDGQQSIDMYGVSHATLEQTFTGLTPGLDYTFSVDYSARDLGRAAEVRLNNGSGFQVLQTITSPGTATNNGTGGLPGTTQFTGTWLTLSHTFTATGTEASIQIANTAGTAVGMIIDNFKFSSDASVCAAVETDPAADVEHFSATLNGDITDNGSGTATRRGFVYGTTSVAATPLSTSAPGETPYDAFVDETGSFPTGAFDLPVSSLTEDTTYYVRSFVQTAGGYAYGNEVTFNTLDFTEPTVTTEPASDVTKTSATLNGILHSLAGFPEASLNLRYRVAGSGDPFLETPAQLTTATGAYSATLSDLSPNTTYEFIAVVQWEDGGPQESLGDALSFTTLPENAATTPPAPSTPNPATPVSTEGDASLADTGQSMGTYALLAGLLVTSSTGIIFRRRLLSFGGKSYQHAKRYVD